jgi:hypothetical protein
MVAEGGSTMARKWSQQHHWHARAGAWDDECRMVEDRERLESLRTMHGNHAKAARAVQAFALQALSRLDAEEATPGDVVRLLDLGVRLERMTLTTSVEELQAGRVSGMSTTRGRGLPLS